MTNVVAFKVAVEPSPNLLTLYCVQSYWSDRGCLAEGRRQQFANMELALRAGKEAARRSPAVRVFRVRGNIEADFWEDPVTIAKFGERATDLKNPAG
jgi:hypothetical protein